MHFKIFGDVKSGNCLKVKWTADYLGLTYDWIETDVMKKANRTQAFLKINPAAQVPAVQFDDGRVLSQSNALITYFAESQGSNLMPAEAWARAKVNQWLFWEQYSHEPAIAVRRFKRAYLGLADADLDPSLLDKGLAALGQMEDALIGEDFLTGNDFTVADIALVAYTRMAGDGGYDLQSFPAIVQWIGRVEHELGLSPYPGYKHL
ncbi:MAG: glutathione S-transferase family protein [Alphaproteobacteria bacterium]|nr:MAG: glutathione S-transferase family protein [Alphaproteobacteria bacterium]